MIMCACLVLAVTTPGEEELLREVMFALQGVEGKFIKFCHSSDAFKVIDKVLKSDSLHLLLSACY